MVHQHIAIANPKPKGRQSGYLNQLIIPQKAKVQKQKKEIDKVIGMIMLINS